MSTAPRGPESEGAVLLRRVSRSMVWNASLLPLISVLNLAAAVLIRRYFGLQSGLYDVLIGLLNTALFYSSFGIPISFTQFVPRLEQNGGRAAVRAFVLRAGLLRLSTALAAAVVLTLSAPRLARLMPLGPHASILLLLLGGLLLLRAATELAIKTLQALLHHLAANLLLLGRALLVATALAVTFAQGLGMEAVLWALILSAAVVAVTGWAQAARTWRRLPPGQQTPTAGWLPVSTRKFTDFAAFMYLFDLSNYFSGPAYAATALGSVLSSVGPIALFTVALQVPQMIVVVVLAGFQGLYRPMFSRLLAGSDRSRMRTAYAEVSKVQALLLLPAGVGLWLLLGDLIPLLFSTAFAGAVPIARVLTAFLFCESLFNLGTIVLSVDRRYRAVMSAQVLRIAAAPAFVWIAAHGDLLAAAVVFGAGRLAAVTVGHVLARRRYGVRLPWQFLGRLALPTGLMALLVASARTMLSTSWPEVLGLSGAGALVMVAGLRLFHVLGPREVDLLQRTRLPGTSRIIAWLAEDV